MSHHFERQEMLARLGVETVPALQAESEEQSSDDEWEIPYMSGPPIKTVPVRTSRVPTPLVQRLIEAMTDPGQEVPQLCFQGPGCLGHPRKALPYVRHRGQLARWYVSWDAIVI